MSYHNNCFPFIERAQIFCYSSLIVCIKCICCLIKKDKLRIFINHARNENPLSLSLAYPLPILSYHCVIA